MYMTLLQRFISIAAMVMLPVAAVLAGEGEEEMPSWFPMLELGGVLLGIVISGIAFSVYQSMKGGMIGEGFGKIFLGILSITMGVAVNGLNEMLGLLSEFGAELTFELFIYFGLILIGFGVKKVSLVAA